MNDFKFPYSPNEPDVFQLPKKDIDCVNYEIIKNDDELKNTCETIEQYKTYNYYHPIC